MIGLEFFTVRRGQRSPAAFGKELDTYACIWRRFVGFAVDLIHAEHIGIFVQEYGNAFITVRLQDEGGGFGSLVDVHYFAGDAVVPAAGGQEETEAQSRQ